MPPARIWAVSSGQHPQNLTRRNLAELPQKKGISCPVCTTETSSFGGMHFDSCCETPSDFQSLLLVMGCQAPSFCRHARVAECVGAGGGVGASHAIRFHSWAFGGRCTNKQFTSRRPKRHRERAHPPSGRQETPLSLHSALGQLCPAAPDLSAGSAKR